ncbi:Undecaprenyl-phosphate glucose phosphotransferase [Sphaerochaeta pleomorpha str. Grapes]|uniref:Undecaprenyl-phosphate glucose phosphotransferase n=1 Tax=Sphaerochaeta pleomorpha (strain ATCC BAA-1885 / DSM 22778 / Grapes) TaxID=158190 RepID=G8QS49_SPHPG|nr:undecaprenyl-phosphate glucose phosphotransferase [Sphaerochaeta pleomorpha]AEV28910.1 Undecaprenyl-phosphate glucose phosphotransferase [Sphaerochaeta pleomorpha str. Grapes]
MLRRFKQSLVIGKIIADSIAILVSWFLAYYLRFYVLPGGRRDSLSLFLSLSVLVLVMFFFFFSKNKLYDQTLDRSWRKETSWIFTSAFQVFLLLVVILYYFFPSKVSRITIALFFIFAVFLLILERTIIAGAIKKAYRKGRFTQRVLLVGFGDKLQEYQKALVRVCGAGVNIVGQYDSKGVSLPGCAQIEAASLREAVTKTKPDNVVIGYPGREYDRQQEMVAQGLDLLEQKVALLPSIPESYIGTKISDFRWIPMLHLNAAEIGVFQRFEKRLFDITSCSVAVLLLSPVFLIISILIKISSPGPIIFKQRRVTRDEKVFTMYKFRSMRTDMAEGAVHWTEENDPRITKIGRFLRRTSLDELPQLFNVIGGSMSLIGPRPERPELVERFNSEIPGYRMRHRAKAGISGWAQVNGWRGNTSLERRIEFDLYYIRNWSALFDMKIVFFTFFRGFVNENAY